MRSQNDSRIHAHSFRHYFITESRKQGIPQEIVGDQVGHKNISTSRMYTHFDIDNLKDKYQSVNI